MQSPVGALAPNVINTLQEIIASPIGAEAEEVLAALAQFGDSLVARFFRGYTSVTDIFAHAFDELGAELGGIPGMSGVTAWVSSIEELIGTAMNLIEEVFNGVTGIVEGLSFAVTGKGVEGNIAEGMHNVVEGLTLFLKLVNMAMDLIQELIDGVLGVAGGTMSQLVQVLSWVIGVANQFLLFFHSIYDVFASLLGFAPGGDRPLSALTDALPNLLTAFSPLNAAKLVGQIPNALIKAVWDAISGLLPKSLFDTFLGGLKGSANTGAGGTTGFPTFDDALNAIGGLFGKADTAQTDAGLAMVSAQAAVQTTGVTTTGELGTLRWTRVVFATVGTSNWTVPTPTQGYRLERVDVQAVGPGQGGPQVPLNYLGRAEGGLPGGFIRRSFIPEEIGPAGTTYALSIPGGTAGATSRGPAAMPPRTTMRRQSDNALLIQSSEPGTSGILTTAGIPSTFQAPGQGGANGPAVYTGSDSNGQSSYSYTDGEPGEPSLEAPGGNPGRGATGWFGSGATSPGNGQDAPTSHPYYCFCGGGGGGGCGKVNAPGGNGGNPGGGGGAGSPNNGTPFFPSPTPGGSGGRGEIAIWIVEAPL